MTDGTQEERERVQALLDLDAHGDEEELVEEAIAKGWSPGETSRRILERRKQRRESELAARVADEEQMEAPGTSTRRAGDEATSEARFRELLAAGRAAGVRHRGEAR